MTIRIHDFDRLVIHPLPHAVIGGFCYRWKRTPYPRRRDGQPSDP